MTENFLALSELLHLGHRFAFLPRPGYSQQGVLFGFLCLQLFFNLASLWENGYTIDMNLS